MKSMMPGFYKPSDAEFKELWKESTFALDTNVLLNLHRYPEKAREELLAVLKAISKRMLVPFQVALEYQRNRPAVIAEQKSRFRDVRLVVEKVVPGLEGEFSRLQLRERHALIDPDRLVNALKPPIAEFLSELGELEKKQGNVQDEDPLRNKIDSLIGKSVGPPPTAEEVSAVSEEAAVRFEACIPPGYMDRKKEGDSATYSYGGIVYEAKYGDLLLWKQLLTGSEKKKVRSLIFLTDDDKEDWWWTIESQGRKKLGPRPELVEEMARVAKVEKFYMYASEQFLKFARVHLDVKISEEAIEQVRDVAARAAHIAARSVGDEIRAVERVVASWIRAHLPQGNLTKGNQGWPDFVFHPTGSDGAIGIEIMYMRGTGLLFMGLRERLYRAYHDIALGRFGRFEVVVVVGESADEERVLNSVFGDRVEVPIGVNITVGKLHPGDTGFEFEPIASRPSDERQSRLFFEIREISAPATKYVLRAKSNGRLDRALTLASNDLPALIAGDSLAQTPRLTHARR